MEIVNYFELGAGIGVGLIAGIIGLWPYLLIFGLLFREMLKWK